MCSVFFEHPPFSCLFVHNRSLFLLTVMGVGSGSQDGQYVRRCTWPTTAADISAAETLGLVTKPGPFSEFSAGDTEVKVAVEYDGPSHFLSSGAPMRPDGSTLIKRRHLQVGPRASSCFPCQIYQHNPY